MNYTRLLMILALMLQGLAAQAKTLNTFSPNTLPAPAWIQATTITSTSIAVEWAPVPGAAQYKLERFDETHGVALPDVFLPEPQYVSEPHDPGTTISFTVAGVEANGQVGAPTNAEFTTTIIVVDVIASLTIPGPPTWGKSVFSNANFENETMDANKLAAYMDVDRIKVWVDGSPQFYAEVLFWSFCSENYDNPVRIRYLGASSTVNYTENHLGGNPLGPIVSVTYKLGQAPFFTLHKPEFALGLDGNPSKLRVSIRNDRTTQIRVGVSTSTSTDNPCYDPPEYSTGGNQPTTLISAGEDMEDNGAELSVIKTQQDLSVQPNPFSDNFTIQYALDAESPVQIALLDNMGRQVKNIQLPTQAPGNHNIVIQTNDLPTGIYQLALQTSQGRQLTTLVKQP